MKRLGTSTAIVSTAGTEGAPPQQPQGGEQPQEEFYDAEDRGHDAGSTSGGAPQTPQVQPGANGGT
eukprot:1804399-Prymnesium_polylepis.1